MRIYKPLIFILFSVSIMVAQNVTNPDSLYISGNDAMLQEDFSTAVNYYEQLVDQGKNHPDLYYNLGNAYYRLNQIGNAVWAYERGLQFAPRDKDLKFNLSLANNRVRDRIEMPLLSPILAQYRNFKNSALLLDVLLIAAAMFMLGAFIYFLKKYYRWESIWISRLIITFFISSILVHFIVLDKYFELSNTNNVIINEPEVEIYSAPFEKRETVLFRLHDGVKAEVTQEQGEWIEIILIDGKKGWIPSTKVRQL